MEEQGKGRVLRYFGCGLKKKKNEQMVHDVHG